MPLQAKYSAQADIPEALRENYKQIGSVWLLQIEGGAPEGFIERAKFNEVDGELKKAKTDLQKFEGIDADKARTADAQLKAILDSLGGKDPKAFADAQQAYVQGELAKHAQDHANAVKKLQDDLDAERGHKRTLLTDRELRSRIASDPRIRPEAIEDVTELLLPKLDFEGDKIIVKENGRPKLNSDGSAYTAEQLVKDTLAVKTHFLQPSSGGGSAQTANRGSASGTDGVPRKADGSVNLTQLMALKDTNPAEFKRITDSGEHLKTVAAAQKAA